MVRPSHDPDLPATRRPSDASGWHWREDPTLWSLPLFRIRGLAIRAHVVLLLFVAFELVLSISGARLGPLHVGSAMAALVANVILREACRALVAHSLGAEPAPVILWPLGSLSGYEVPGSRLARMVVALSGTAIGGALCVTLAGVLLLCGASSELVFFNPVDPGATAARVGTPGTLVLWWCYAVTLIVTLVNLIPIFPLDAGRAIEAAVADRSIRRAGILLASKVGMIVSLVVFVAAMTASMERLMGLAVVAGMVCWIERRRAEFISQPLVPAWRAAPESRARAMDPLERLEADLAGLDASDADPGVERGSPVAAGTEACGGDDDIDPILEKISRSGLESLTGDERAALEAARERRLRRENRDRGSPKDPPKH